MKTSNIFYGIVAVVAIILIVLRFVNWNVKKEGFVNKKCPDNTRSDGPCLMEF